MISTVVVSVVVGGLAVLPINMYVQSGQPDRLRKAVKGKRGCRFGCFHIEMIRDQDDKPKVLCRKGWPRVSKAGFSRLQYDTARN